MGIFDRIYNKDVPQRKWRLLPTILWLAAMLALLSSISSIVTSGAAGKVISGPAGAAAADAESAGLALDQPTAGDRAARPAGNHPLQDQKLRAASIQLEALQELPAAIQQQRIDAYIQASSPEQLRDPELLRQILPPGLWFQALLLHPSDLETMRLDAQLQSSYGRLYRDIVSQQISQAGTAAVQKLLDSLWAASDAPEKLAAGEFSPLARGDRWLPPERQLSATHRYALDIFYTWLDREGRNEVGPPIRSIGRGIVVAAANDWSGGDRPSLYRSGGLSPKAGNGIIIYCPDNGHWYLYLHLDGVTVTAGEMVAAGQIIGNGGNTGINARKSGHGGHLHLEIFNRSIEAWSSYQIRRYLVNLR